MAKHSTKLNVPRLSQLTVADNQRKNDFFLVYYRKITFLALFFSNYMILHKFYFFEKN